MRRLLGLILAGGIVLGHAAVANAQFSVAVGNPYMGSGFAVGTPGYGYSGYGYGYPSYGGYSSYAAPLVGATTYNSGYGGYSPYAAPLVGTTTYSSGYAGYAAPGTTFYNSSYYPATAVYTPVYPAYRSGRYYGYAPYSGWRGGLFGGRGVRRW